MAPLLPSVASPPPWPEREARLVKDFVDTPYSEGTEFEEMVALNDVLLFSARNRTQGRELWRSDGTPEGTWLVKDLRVQNGSSSSPSRFLVTGNNLYFEAIHDLHGWSYAKSDGTASGTRYVMEGLNVIDSCLVDQDIYVVTNNDEQYSLQRLSTQDDVLHPLLTFADDQTDHRMLACGNRLCLLLDSRDRGWDYWTSDGTIAGTELVAGGFGGYIEDLLVFNSHLFLVRNEEAYGREPWIMNLATGEMTLLGDLIERQTSSGPSAPFLFDNQIYFWAVTSNNWLTGLWRTDGTAENTVLIKQFDEEDQPRDLPAVILQDQFYFHTSSGTLWKSDGTSAGTVPAVSLPNLTEIDDLTAHEGLLYFAGNSPAHGNELWRSDGTVEGTFLVKDIAPGPDQHSNPWDFVSVAGKLFFLANDQTHGGELWVTEGTPESTRMVRDIAGGTESSEPIIHHTADSPSLLYLSVAVGFRQSGLWAWNWKRHRAELLANFGESWRSHSFMQFGEDTYFLAAREFSPEHSTLWLSDGSREGTQPVDEHFYAWRAAAFNGSIYLGGFPYSQPWQNWDSEVYRHIPGTGSIEFFHEFHPDDDSFFEFFGELNSRLMMAAFSPDVGYEMFQVDGVPENTSMVKDIEPGASGGVNPSDGWAVVDGILYFGAYTSVHGSELWRSDGTEAGTWIVKDIIPGSVSSYPEGLTGAETLLYFYAQNGVHGEELWVSDGTADGTKMLRDIFPGTEDVWPPAPIALGNNLVFQADDGVHGQELWITDGTTEGTTLLKDIWPGPGSSYARNFALSADGNRVYFTASHEDYGDELWQTDGSPQGTVLLADVNPGTAPSKPSGIVEKGGFIYFAADSETFGRELFAVPTEATAQHPYTQWIANSPDLDMSQSGWLHDPGSTGLCNGLRFLLGGTPLSNATHILPTATREVPDPDGTPEFVFSFRHNTSVSEEEFRVETTTDLVDFRQAISGVDGVTIQEEPDYFGPGISRVQVRVPCAENNLMVGRLRLTAE